MNDIESKYEAFSSWMRGRLATDLARKCGGDEAATRIACESAAKAWFAALIWQERQPRVPATSLSVTPEVLEDLAAPVPLEKLSDDETMRLIRAAMWGYGKAMLLKEAA